MQAKGGEFVSVKVKFNGDLDKIIRDKATDALNNRSYELECPHCRRKVKVPVGKSNCPLCHKEIDLSLDIHFK